MALTKPVINGGGLAAPKTDPAWMQWMKAQDIPPPQPTAQALAPPKPIEPIRWWEMAAPLKPEKASLESLLGSFRKTESDDSRVGFLDTAVGLYGQLAVKDSLTTEELGKYNWDIRASDWARYGILADFVHWGNEFHKVFGWISERADPEQLKRVTANVPEFQEIVLDTLLPIYKTEPSNEFPFKTWEALLTLAVERYGAEELVRKVEGIGAPNQWDRIKQEIMAEKPAVLTPTPSKPVQAIPWWEMTVPPKVTPKPIVPTAPARIPAQESMALIDYRRSLIDWVGEQGIDNPEEFTRGLMSYGGGEVEMRSMTEEEFARAKKWKPPPMPTFMNYLLPSFLERIFTDPLAEESLARITQLYTKKEVAEVMGESIKKLPYQAAASVLQATQGQGGASVVNRDWADRLIKTANQDIEQFSREVAEEYPSIPFLVEVSRLSQNLAYSLTSMGAGLAVGIPVAFIPLPGARIVAWGAGTAASGAVAYQMTTYQIMQEYLELKDAEKKAQTGRGLTLEEENQLKKDFHGEAVKYGLWEAVPEALSNLAFGLILVGPLGRMIGGPAAQQITTKLAMMFGEELLTETITQKGQSDIEVEAGLREKRIGWVEAFKEIAPQTFLLTTIMGGAGQVIVSSSQAIQKIQNSLKNEIGETHPLYEEIQQGIESELGTMAMAEWGTVTGQVSEGIAEAPTTAMAEWETVSGIPPEGIQVPEEGITPSEDAAVVEVSGVPPKLPKDWDKIGGDLYDRFKRQATPNPTPNTVPITDRLRQAERKLEAFVADELAGLNKLGWQAELDLAMVRAAPGRASELYRETMRAVAKSINNDSNLLSYVDDYLMLRHQLEVLKATERKYFTITKGNVSERFTAKQIGLLFAQMKKELGAVRYGKVKEAASHVPALYNQVLKENQELTPGQIDGLIKKYPWFNPIVFERETSPINIGRRLSPRQIKQLTNLETDKEQMSPLLSLPTIISRRMRAQATNEARRSVAEMAVKPENRSLIGGDVGIVIKKPTGAFIDYYAEGQHRYLKLGKGAEWMAKDIELLQRQPPGMLIRNVRSLQNLSKMFFTTYNPGFVAWNTVFDAVTSLFAEGITPWGFGKALAGNIKGMFADVPGLNEFRKSGGEQFGFFVRGPDIGKEADITPFISKKGGQLVLRNPESLKRFINPFVLIRELGVAGENAARKAVYEKATKEGLSPKEAALRARRVTVDFSRFSKASRVINDWYIYFNPALQGFMLPGRAIKKDPRSIWRLAALLAGYVGLTLYNMSYDEYDDVRDSDKVGKLLVMLPSDEYNKYGQKVPHYLTLMPMREFAFFTAPIEYLLGRLRTEEPEAYRTLAQEWDVFYPVVSPLSMISEAGGIVPPTQIWATIQQIIQNHDDFRDRDIVDDEMALLPATEQYDQYTNKMAIRIGQALGMSPKKLDFFVSNMFGALGNDLLREVNRAIEIYDREVVDPRIAELVSELRAIPTNVPPNRIEVARETFLEGLSVEDRDLVLNMERLPDDQIPFVQSVFRRFFRDYGGQVYQTAKEKALLNRTLEDYPPEALAQLQKDANENANNLLKGKITKKDYDDNRSRYRAYYSGASTAQWREGMIEGAVARSDIDKYMPEAYQRSEEFQAVSAYMEIRQKYIDEVGGVFDSDAWDKIEEQTLEELRKDFSEIAVQYALVHKDDWIDKLPEPARTVERQRAIAIEDESWWEDYRGEGKVEAKEQPVQPWWEQPSTVTPSTTTTPKNWWEK